MTPETPVIPGLEKHEIKFAENQDEYQTLVALKFPDGTVITRWRLTWRERLVAFINGDVYLSVSTFNQPLQPIFLEVDEPKVLVGADDPIEEVAHA